MLKGLGQHLCIGVARGGVALARKRAWRPGLAELLAERRLAAAGDAEIAAAVRELLTAAAPTASTVSIVLADDLVRMWQVAPPAGCARMSDLLAAAAMRFQHLFGSGTAGWRITADWDLSGPFLAVAAPQSLLDPVEAAVRDYGGHVVEVVPQFVAALNQWRRVRTPGAWFGLLQGPVLTLALYQNAALAAVRSALVPHGAGRDWLDSHVAREALRVGIDRPERLQVCGPAPDSWASHEGQLKYVCTLLDRGTGSRSDLARIACIGSAG
ncbi:hypothetical protein NX773_10880 [Massilia solisilvae]|uniref:Uncharacterized protein n=1 Tax=Massilia solisilvae TaxID=1811225 RepID=A0ABT2BJH6_9BURK|nr:hypothetical protein [Massilia solisilvae]MCS0608667.1 hypothetical protein [Massilia solisilvae]